MPGECGAKFCGKLSLIGFYVHVLRLFCHFSYLSSRTSCWRNNNKQNQHLSFKLWLLAAVLPSFLLLRLWWTDRHVLSFNYTQSDTRIVWGHRLHAVERSSLSILVCSDDMLPETRIPIKTLLLYQRKNVKSFSFLDESVMFQIATLRELSHCVSIYVVRKS